MIERIALTLGRCLLGLYFLVPGLSKITGYSGTLAYMQLHNVPFSDLLLPLTIVLQVGGGLALLSGFRIRDTALMLAGLTIAINIGMHDFLEYVPRGFKRPRDPEFCQKPRDLRRAFGAIQC